MKGMKKILFVTFLACISVVPSFVGAQINVNIPYALSNELGIEIIPNYPRPNERVWVNLSLHTDDLNSADIAWYRGGKVELQGKGKVSYSFVMGKVGQESKIEIRIKLLSGVSFSKSFTLNPASVDMPEFVKNGKRIPAENLVYEWSNDSEVFQSQSGYGKNVLNVSGSILGSTDEFEVLVTDPVNNIVAEDFITINPVDPKISFYENNPYYGYIFDTAISPILVFNSEELYLTASPYYMSREANLRLKYHWRLNSQSLPELEDSRTAIFRRPEEAGSSIISLRLENTNRILQEAEKRINIRFDD